MGWGRYFLLGDFGQQLDIEEHRNELTSLRRQLARARQSRSSGASAAELAQEVDELRLFIAALLRLLCAQGTIDANELRSLVEAIDGEDGNADGRHRGPLLPEADPSGPATPPSNSR